MTTSLENFLSVLNTGGNSMVRNKTITFSVDRQSFGEKFSSEVVTGYYHSGHIPLPAPGLWLEVKVWSLYENSV